MPSPMNEINHYCPHCGHRMYYNQILCPKCGVCCELYEAGIHLEAKSKSRGEDKSKALTAAAAILDGDYIEANMQWRKYWCGADGRTGHGFAAEDANAFHDKMTLHKVYQVGKTNEKNGADRLVSGTPIQSKYCGDAKGTINSVFDANGSGLLKYLGTDGTPMQIEVPRDQYEGAVEAMKEKIRNGQVPGVSDPEQAANIVKKGKFTYRQAQNLARAGNIDSLTYDAITGSVIALGAFSITFIAEVAMSFANRSANCFTKEDIIYACFEKALRSGSTVLVTHVLTQQYLRTKGARSVAAFTESVVRHKMQSFYFSTGVGRKMALKSVEGEVAKEAGKKELNREVKKKVGEKVTKAAGKAGTRAVAEIVFFAVEEYPVVSRYLRGKASPRQTLHDTIVNVCTIGGGALGSLFGGWGAIPGTFAGQYLGQKAANALGESDEQLMLKIVLVAKIHLAEDYLLQSEEMKYVNDLLEYYQVIDKDFLTEMYARSKKDGDFEAYRMAYNRMEYYFDRALRKRKDVVVRDSLDRLAGILVSEE